MKKRTARQIEASRRNGATSKGPVTPEGKQRSSVNGLKHGLASGIVVLCNENKEAYAGLTAEYMDYYEPATPPERDLVNDIICARWRLTRVITLETAAIDLEMHRQRPKVAAEIISTDGATRCAMAYIGLADGGCSLAMLNRQEARLRRTIDRATARLAQLQAERRQAEAAGAGAGDADTMEEAPAASPDAAQAPRTENCKSEPGDVQLVSVQPVTTQPVARVLPIRPPHDPLAPVAPEPRPHGLSGC